MAAIQAAGFQPEMASPSNHPIRAQILEELKKRNIPSLPALESYIAKHHKPDPNRELGQYISIALCAGPPPAFALTRRDVELPPGVTAMSDFIPLLAAFWKEANIQDLWNRSQPAIDQYIKAYHAPVSEAVLQVNVYLRQQTSGFHGRRFQVLLELLGPPNQVQTRNYGDDSTIVITPSQEVHAAEVRHAYLHYLLDPLAARYHEVLERKKGLGDHALRAGALEDQYKEDFLALATESLIKAVEARLDKKPEEVQDALLNGHVLAPYFSEALLKYEKQEQAMLLYYPLMVGAIDLVKEDARLSKVEFNRTATVRTVKVPVAPPPPVTGAAKTLEDAETAYKSKEWEQAKKLFLSVLQQTDQKPMHAAAYYGLARVALFEREPETGERLFLKTLDLEPEPFVRAWTLVFLGRMSIAASKGAKEAGAADESAAEKGKGLKYFQDALAVEGATEDARKAAQQGIDQISKL